QFKTYKEQYLNGIKIPFDTFLILDKMYKSGQLNVKDEFYYYVSNISSPIELSENVSEYLKNIAINNKLNLANLIEFFKQYTNIIFVQNKELWIYQYEINNKLLEESNENII